jgi:hypothetical protein
MRRSSAEHSTRSDASDRGRRGRFHTLSSRTSSWWSISTISAAAISEGRKANQAGADVNQGAEKVRGAFKDGSA